MIRQDLQLDKYDFPVLESRLKLFQEAGGKFYRTYKELSDNGLNANPDYNWMTYKCPISSGVYIPSKLAIEYVVNTDLGSRICTVFHELSHFIYVPRGYYPEQLLHEEIRCHSEMYNFYIYEVKAQGLIARDMEKDLIVLESQTLEEMVSARYERFLT